MSKDTEKRFIVVKIIRREGKPDKYKTSHTPRKHFDMEMALREATRLANKERKPFAIFQDVACIVPTH